ncbi:hypothetical protein LTR37_002237 [Vermiconidia calcicola]|uniref:Uncharacterized protein n=1 Tax=Vermiconidia calcicola TaxID=1690605 RepID=A0ACC3NTY3_9PEZI|nr:hypothetical protein LTR37_002237 [Vermiconidia calcicola]
MLEEPVNVGNQSPVNGNVPHGLPFPRSEPLPAGFTAVNGESQAMSSFRPAGRSRPTITSPDNGSPRDTIVVSTKFHSHGWRPDAREASEMRSESEHYDGLSHNKRKRNDEVGNDGELESTVEEGRQSPKRRYIPIVLDSAVDLTSPDTAFDRRLPEIASTGRERSPVNQGEPPPKVRPETEKRLAESVLKFNQGRHVLELQQAQPTAAPQGSPPDEDYDQQQSPAQDDDQPQGDNYDSKKGRKRNFSNRTKSGCHTCRSRKKKCDEAKPICNNCERGGFPCGGYGPKPPGHKLLAQSRAVIPLQPSSKAAHETPPQGPTGHWPPASDGRNYSHWGRVPPATEYEPSHPYLETPLMDPRQPSSRDGPPGPIWPPREHHPPPPPLNYYRDRHPPADVSHIPRPPMHAAEHQPLPSLPPPPGLPQIDPWAQPPGLGPYRPQTGPPTAISSSYSGSSSSGHRHLGLGYGIVGETEKEKMLRGKLYLHFTDSALIHERNMCLNAVYRYNRAADPDTSGLVTANQRAKLFTEILEPPRRNHKDSREHWGPIGEIQDCTIVDSPFKCDYGYHIHIGKECTIMSGCYMQDGGGIFVGDRCIIGSNVQLLTMTASVDSNLRRGSQGKVRAGSIWIQDDVLIGAGAIVLPYVTIGKGAVVGAGSVVTKDVEENTVVVGNPAKTVRKIEAANGDKHYSYKVQKQEEKALERMSAYANAGFKDRSPRL